MEKETHKGRYLLFNQDNLPSGEHFIDSEALLHPQSHSELVSGTGQMCVPWEAREGGGK